MKLKLFVKNTHNEIRRVDKLSGPIMKSFPKVADYVRRNLLCVQGKIPYYPYKLLLTKEEFNQFQSLIGDKQDNARKPFYTIVDENGIAMLVVEQENNQKENGQTGISTKTE